MLAIGPPGRTSYAAARRSPGTPTASIATSAPARRSARRRHASSAGVVDCDVGAELLACVEPELSGFDRRSTLDGLYRPVLVIADRPTGPAPTTATDVAGPHAAREHADLVAGGQDVGQHDRLLVADALRDRVGEVRRRHADDSACVPSMRWPKIQPSPRRSAVRGSSLAVPARPQLVIRDEHAVAHANALDRVADRVIVPTASWPRIRPSVTAGDVALQDVQVGAADRGPLHRTTSSVRSLDRRVRHVLPGLVAGTVVRQRLHRHSVACHRR